MTSEPKSIIWATRGRVWGFRFLRAGGLADPLPAYEAVFRGLANEEEVLRRVGKLLACRFADPEGRNDAAGRAIRHDFVVPPPLAKEIYSLEDALRLIWQPLAADYARLWDAPARKLT